MKSSTIPNKIGIFIILLVTFSSSSTSFADACTGQSNSANMQQGYCAASTAAKKAADANRVSAALYAAAGAVCGVACFTTWAADSMDIACNAGSMAAGAADMIETQSFSGAMGMLYPGYNLAKQTGIIGGGASAADKTGPFGLGAKNATDLKIEKAGQDAVDQAKNIGPQTPEQLNQVRQEAEAGAEKAAAAAGEEAPSTVKNGQACMSAAIDVGTAGMNMYSASQSDKTAQQNAASAAQVATSSTTPTFNVNGPSSTSNGGSAANGANRANAQTGSISGSSGGSSDNCSSALSTGSVSAAVGCAAASAASVPPIANNPNFANMLQKATGMDPSQFMKQAMNNPAGAAAAGVINGAGLTGTSAAKVAEAFATLEKLGENSPGYSGGGGGRRPSGGGDDGMATMMAGLMGALGPKKEGEEAKKTGNTLNFAKKAVGDRYPAGVEENRKVSLFARITNRYQMVSMRVLPGTLK